MFGIIAEVSSQLQNFKSAFLQNTRVLDVSDSNHSSTLLKGIYGFYKEQRYCDVTLKISDEQKILVHRVVLASASRYFDSLFGSKFLEANNDEVELRSFDGSIMNCLIDFAYTGNICIDAENVYALLHAANCLAVTKSGTGPWGLGDWNVGRGTRGRGDAGTWGRGDSGTRGRRDVGTRGRGDVGT